VDRRFPITCAVHPSENRYKVLARALGLSSVQG
jgi:hypothetical protein